MSAFNQTSNLDNDSLARRFTDTTYYTKDDIVKRFGGDIFNTQVDSICRTVNEYRRRYAFKLELSRYDRKSFTTTLTPSILTNYIIDERSMIYYSNNYNNMKMCCVATHSSTLENILNEIYCQEFISYANKYELDIDRDRIYDCLKKGELFDSQDLNSYYNAIKYLINNPNIALDIRLIRELWGFFNPNYHQDAMILRNSELVDSIINDERYPEYSSDTDKISSLLSKLLSFYAEQQFLSTITLACAFYSAFIYIAPLKSHNLEIANLLFMKILADNDYGESSYSLFFSTYIDTKLNEFKKAINESRKTGDLTYSMLFVSDMVRSSIVKNVAILSKEPIPQVRK